MHAKQLIFTSPSISTTCPCHHWLYCLLSPSSTSLSSAHFWIQQYCSAVSKSSHPSLPVGPCHSEIIQRSCDCGMPECICFQSTPDLLLYTLPFHTSHISRLSEFHKLHMVVCCSLCHCTHSWNAHEFHPQLCIICQIPKWIDIVPLSLHPLMVRFCLELEAEDLSEGHNWMNWKEMCNLCSGENYELSLCLKVIFRLARWS